MGLYMPPNGTCCCCDENPCVWETYVHHGYEQGRRCTARRRKQTTDMSVSETNQCHCVDLSAVLWARFRQVEIVKNSNARKISSVLAHKRSKIGSSHLLALPIPKEVTSSTSIVVFLGIVLKEWLLFANVSARVNGCVSHDFERIEMKFSTAAVSPPVRPRHRHPPLHAVTHIHQNTSTCIHKCTHMHMMFTERARAHTNTQHSLHDAPATTTKMFHSPFCSSSRRQ